MEPIKKLETPTIMESVENVLTKVFLEYPFRMVGWLDDKVAGRMKKVDEEVETK